MTKEAEMLALAELRQANIMRQQEWDTFGQLTLAYRGNELAGEVGEACNVIKKLERERFGINGSRDTVEHLAEELADVIICTDLIAMQAGIDLDAAVIAKFNASSEKVGLATRLAAASLTPSEPIADVGPVEREALLTRGWLRSVCIAAASPNMTDEAAERQADRIADAILALLSTRTANAPNAIVEPLYANPPAPSLPGREEIAAHFLAADASSDLEWARSSLAVWRIEDHLGDCEYAQIKGPATCSRCCADEAYRRADDLLALLALPVTPGDDQTPVVQIASGDLLCEACGAWTPAALVPKSPEKISAEPIDAQQPEAEARVTDEYQPRTRKRLIEILIAQNQNPRSWQQEAAELISAPQAEPVYEAGWRDIASAPKDGTQILLWSSMWEGTWGIQVGSFSQLEEMWETSEGRVQGNDPGFDPDSEFDEHDFDSGSNQGPTHWQPLPTPPKGGADGK